MFHKQEEWVLLGITSDGQVFDCEDWTEQLCGMLSEKSGSNRLSYSDYLHPVYIDSLPAVVLESELEEVDAESFRIVRKFAVDNRLKVRSGRTAQKILAEAKHPTLGIERRDPTKKHAA